MRLYPILTHMEGLHPQVLGGAVSLDVTSDALSSEPPSRPLTPEEKAGNDTENAGNEAEGGAEEEATGTALSVIGGGESAGQGGGLQAEWQQFDDAVSVYVCMYVCISIYLSIYIYMYICMYV